MLERQRNGLRRCRPPLPGIPCPKTAAAAGWPPCATATSAAPSLASRATVRSRGRRRPGAGSRPRDRPCASASSSALACLQCNTSPTGACSSAPSAAARRQCSGRRHRPGDRLRFRGGVLQGVQTLTGQPPAAGGRRIGQEMRRRPAGPGTDRRRPRSASRAGSGTRGRTEQGCCLSCSRSLGGGSPREPDDRACQAMRPSRPFADLEPCPRVWHQPGCKPSFSLVALSGDSDSSDVL